MSDPFIEQLKELCRQHPIVAKWVFVPHAGLRWTLGERLLLEGCNWVNLRFVTPFQLALEGAAPQLLERGIDPCPESLGPSLLQNLLLQLPGAGYFAPLVLQPGMAEALWRSLQEFRLAGLCACDLTPDSPKNRELRELFQAYEDYLETHRLADRAIVLATPPHTPGIGEGDFVLVYPYHRWSALEQRWLQDVPGQRLQARLDSERPTPSSQFFWALRRSDEIDGVAWKLRQAGTPLDQVEIVAAPEDCELIQERMSALGLPCTFESGLPTLSSRPGQALHGLLHWVEHGLSAYHLRDLLGADLLRAQPDSFTATRLLEAAQITWGRQTYHPQLQALAEVTRQRSSSPEKTLQDLEALSAWLRQLFQRLPPANAVGEVAVQRWLEGLQETLRRDFFPRDAAEEGGRQALLGALQELKMLPGEHWPQQRFLALLRQRLQSLRVGASRARPGHLHVIGPETLGLSGRPLAFWVGLEEGRWLTAPAEDCVFSDVERQPLGLTTSAHKAQERVEGIRQRLRFHPGQLTMSYARREMTGDQEQLPAWLFLEAARNQRPELDTYDKLQQWLGPPLEVPIPCGGAPLPALAQGARAEALRNSPEFTAYDGYVPEAAGLFDPRQGAGPMSVSRLKALATCPFQVFLETGLRLQRPPMQLPEPDVWLDAATRGTLLHEVYAAYHRALRSRSWKPDLERDRQQLLNLLQAQLDKLRALLPPPSGALEKAEIVSLKRDLDHFLRLEVEQSQRTPIGFEVPFGMGPDPLEPLAHPDPVVLDLGGGKKLPLRGRIDRIDQLEQGLGVVDYKTGRGLYTSGRNAVFDRGRLLQHALYALVVEQMHPAPVQVRQSSYYFPTTVAARPWIHYAYPDRDRFFRVLRLVLEPLASGAFAHTHETSKDCAFCDFKAACESHRDENLRAKLDNPNNHALESRRLLLEEE